MIFLARILWYFVRLAIYKCLAVLRFISKPGSRFVVSVALIALAVLLRPSWHAEIGARLREADPGYYPDTIVLDVVLAVCVLALIVAYFVVSKLMGLTLSAFPLAMRPLWPQRRLQPTRQQITPAVVRVVVPPLPRRRM